MLLYVEGQRLFLVDDLVEPVLVAGLGEGHPLHPAFALRSRADPACIEVGLAAARITAVDYVIVAVRVHSPQVLAEPEAILASHEVPLALEVPVKVLAEELEYRL